MKTILFQGDSITESGRYRQNPKSMGNGYAAMAAGWVEYEHPGMYTCLNRGIGGDRITDLYAKIQENLINLKPDIVSILIGVNDIWGNVADDMGNSPEKFERIYRWIVQEIREKLPETKILLLGPYVIEGSGTCNTEEFPHRWEFMRDGVAEMAKATQRVAEEFSLAYVPLQEAFDEALTKAPSAYWTTEGVHPTPAGYEIEAVLLGEEKLSPKKIAKLMNFHEVDNAQTQFLINTFNQVGDIPIWHIHGEARKPDSMILGH